MAIKVMIDASKIRDATARSGLCGWSTCCEDRVGQSMFCAEHHLRAIAARCPKRLMIYRLDLFGQAMDWSNTWEDKRAERS